PPAPGERRADAEHADRAAGREDGVRVLGEPLDLRARGADEVTVVGGRDHDDAVAAGAELVAHPLDEAIDLVVLLPGVRRDLGDREALRGHDAGGYTPRRARGPACRSDRLGGLDLGAAGQL